MKLKAQNIQFALILSLFLGGPWAGVAQEAQVPEPMIVKIADMQREDRQLRPRWIEKTACLSFVFKDKSEAEVIALAKQGVEDHRRVHVSDGTNIVAKCRVVGVHRSTHPRLSGETFTRDGLIFGFDTMAEAEQAAVGMAEPLEDIIRRKANDRATWML